MRRQLDNVIEFLFFLTLVWCAQKMLSHAIGTHLSQTVPHSSNRPPPAFAFHRTAFKERIDALRESLQVIEHLRNYRPKTLKHAHAHTASGTRTPVFASFGFGTPAGEKGGFEWGVRRASTPRAGTPEPLSGVSALGGAVHTDSDWDADEEEGADGMGKGKGKSKGKGKAKDKGKDKGKGKKAKRGSAGFGYDVDADASASPHRYPPTPTPDGAGAGRRSSEEDGGAAVVAQAARVLKSAVLHDARNLEGKEGGAGGLVWDVTSAHEAKVRLARVRAELPLYMCARASADTRPPAPRAADLHDVQGPAAAVPAPVGPAAGVQHALRRGARVPGVRRGRQRGPVAGGDQDDAAEGVQGAAVPEPVDAGRGRGAAHAGPDPAVLRGGGVVLRVAVGVRRERGREPDERVFDRDRGELYF